MRFRSLVASLCLAASTLTAVAQNGDRAGETQTDIPAEWTVAESPVRSATEELATFSIVDGFRIELVASEALVEAPVAIEFGPDGRMWVVEMRGYMRDADGGGERERLGRIKVLRDTDGDGDMDEARVFLDGLVMPRGIAHWRDGLLVIEPPHLLFCRDTDGDGKADESRIVASGFAGEDNPEHAGNGLHFTLDNAFACSQHPVRFLPRGDALATEPVSPHGQWGISEDATGRLYYSPNSDPLLVDRFPKHYAARHPGQRAFEGVPARAATDTRVFPSHLTPGVNRGYQKGVLKDGRLANFTGACSPLVYEGASIDALRGCALVCEVAGNLVHRFRLTESDGRISAAPADGERSFWTSTDERFRPVAATAGPDGLVYVADMYRGIIQHRNFMTTFLRRQVDARGLAQPLDAGRIWRIVPSGEARSAAPENIASLDAAGLLGRLSSPEKALRETARRMLVERGDRSIAPALRAQLAQAREVAIVLEHLWTLAGIQALDAADVAALSRHDSPVVRVHALRAAERALPGPNLAGILGAAIEDGSREVRIQAVLSVGSLDPALRIAVLDAALRRDVDSREMRCAVLSSSAGAEAEILGSIVEGTVLASDSIGARAFAAEFTDLLLDDGSGRPTPATLARTLSTAARVVHDSPSRPWLARTMVERIAARQRLNAKEPVQLVASEEPAGWLAMLDRNAPELQLALSVDRQLFWPGREDVSFVPPKIVKAASMSFEEFGKRLYSNCMSCHQANGRGLPPVYPPLRGSPIVHGDPEVLVKILLHGLEGKIEVDGQTYNQVMPAAPVRGDDEIAAVLSYVRSAWGNTGAAVDAALVARIREEHKGRNKPFTAKELGIGVD